MYEARENRVRRGFERRKSTPKIANERITTIIRHGTETGQTHGDGGRRAGRTRLTLRRLSSVVFQLKLLNGWGRKQERASVWDDRVRGRAGLHRGSRAVREV